MNSKNPILKLIILLVIIAIVTFFGPPEATLGKNIRVVYLHGAWVWTSLATFCVSGLVGIAALINTVRGRSAFRLHQWSRALGRSGLFFWITYLPLSLWAMEANWNGLFLAEPRWRVAVIFAVSGTLLQLGLSFLPIAWASFWNPTFILALFWTLQTTEEVMHPPNPLQSEEAWKIQVFFGALTLLLLLTSWQLSQWFKSFENKKPA